jgi:hypothetical protein
MTLETLKSEWHDTEEYHKHINELFAQLVDADPELKAHRDFVQNNVFGFGERSFWWLWKLIFEGLPDNARMLEIGLFKGATVSLWRLLSPTADIAAISPMDGAGLEWKDDDYRQHVKTIHERFNQSYPKIFEGLSTDRGIKAMFGMEYRYGLDLLYIDGSHEYADVKLDFGWYAPYVKSGGFLVVDDCCCDLHEPFGYFQGISDVQKAFDEYMLEHSDKWEFVFNVVHLRVMRKL